MYFSNIVFLTFICRSARGLHTCTAVARLSYLALARLPCPFRQTVIMHHNDLIDML